MARVCADLGESFDEVDVDADGDLADRFGDEVPVTFVDGRQHDFWRVDEARLRAALVPIGDVSARSDLRRQVRPPCRTGRWRTTRSPSSGRALSWSSAAADELWSSDALGAGEEDPSGGHHTAGDAVDPRHGWVISHVLAAHLSFCSPVHKLLQ